MHAGENKRDSIISASDASASDSHESSTPFLGVDTQGKASQGSADPVQGNAPTALPGDEIVLARLGEIALKGLNRNRFESQLFHNMQYRLRGLGKYKITQSDSRIWIERKDGPTDTKAVIHAIHDVFGYVSASPVRRIPQDMEVLRKTVAKLGESLFSEEAIRINAAKKSDHVWTTSLPISFKIECKRIEKSFPLRSYDVCCSLGDLITERWPETTRVDVHQPDITIYVEIRESIYIYHEIYPARKGLPVGMGGKGMLLLSGGIDSPVAGYRMASRGMRLEAIYFHTPPYTGEDAKKKVIDLAHILARYAGTLTLHIVNFTEVQLTMNKLVPEDMMTIVMRRMMLRIAEAISRERGLKALITGESLGQVASQTLEALVCTDAVAGLPIFRPLIGCDKDETVALAQDIGSFETSILPYEDCCTVFVAKHPKTHPSLENAEKAEAKLDVEALTRLAVSQSEALQIQLKNLEA